MNIKRSYDEHSSTAAVDHDPLSRESIHTLQILDEVATGQPLTQRDLAKKLGIALGMTNNYLKRLVKAGYIEASPGERKRLHYLLTPKGIAEKSALTFRYIKRSYHFFTGERERIGKALQNLQSQGVESVVLYKATVLTEIAMLALLDTNLKLIAIVDDDMAGNQFLGQIIEPEKSLAHLLYDVVVNATGEPNETVLTRMGSCNVESDRIYSL